MQVINVEFFGKTAHAALEPWEGINALDAASLAYSSISALRQQMNPTERWVSPRRPWLELPALTKVCT